MKKMLTLAAAVIVALAAHAQQFNSRVVPTPQKVVRTHGVCKVTLDKYVDMMDMQFWLDADSASTLKKIAKYHKKYPGNPVVVVRTVDNIAGAANQSQAYRLVVTPDEVRFYLTNDSLSFQYANATFALLSSLWFGEIPCMEITDWPAFEYRGWLDDVSRGPITNAEFIEEQQSNLSLAKMNFGSYYTEHSLYNPKYPDIVPQNAILDYGTTSEDLEMMANLQCFAHFEKTLRIPFYQEMMDTKTNVNPATERTYEFLQDQIDNTLKAYSQTRFININCDETEGLGAGRARDYVDKVGASDAYCRHINRVYDLIKPYNKEVLMWGDIVGKEPEMLKKLPKEMQYIVWSYVAQDDYNAMLEPFRKLHDQQGTQFWVAPGVSHWSSIPQVRNYMKNIANLARDGYKAGARGLINTAWDDSGESLFGDCWHAMYWAAEMAWHPIQNTDPKLAAAEMAERERVFNENYNRLENISGNASIYDFAARIYRVGDLASNKWVGDWFNTGALMQPLLDFYPSNVSDEMITRCDSVDLIVGQLLRDMDSSLLPHFTYALHRIQAVSAKSRLRVALHKALESGIQKEVVRAQDMAYVYFRQLHELKKEYLRLWDEEADAYSRDIICERYDRLGNEVLGAFNHVFVTTSAATDGTPIVSMKTIGLNIPIYYTVDGRQPSTGSNLYGEPFRLERSCLVKAVTYNEWDESFATEKYLLLHKGMGHLKSLGTPYSTYRETYSAGGQNALADGELGVDNTYADGHWQGYWGQDVDAVYDFGRKTAVNQISIRACQNTFDWVLAPQVIEVYTSKDGKDWTLVRTEEFHPDFRIGGTRINNDAVRNLGISTQHLRVVVKNPGALPAWHPAPGQDSYMFIDEIVIE